MTIDERIRAAIQDAILNSGRRPIALLLGKPQMAEIDALVFPNGKTAAQSLTPIRDYMGLRLSVQPGVDGIAVITIGRVFSHSSPHADPPAVNAMLIGAHPILF